MCRTCESRKDRDKRTKRRGGEVSVEEAAKGYVQQLGGSDCRKPSSGRLSETRRKKRRPGMVVHTKERGKTGMSY
jgi:hypothetical protein